MLMEPIVFDSRYDLTHMGIVSQFVFAKQLRRERMALAPGQVVDGDRDSAWVHWKVRDGGSLTLRVSRPVLGPNARVYAGGGAMTNGARQALAVLAKHGADRRFPDALTCAGDWVLAEWRIPRDANGFTSLAIEMDRATFDFVWTGRMSESPESAG